MSGQPEIAELVDRPVVMAAERWLLGHDEETLRTQVELSEIPAPPFQEAARAERMVELLRGANLLDVHTDRVGNVIGHRAGASEEPPLVLSAHLDTVFPEGTDVSVAREGDVLRGPGISDDARGLATLHAIAMALDTAGVVTLRPILFVATVGEEGLGDLRGVKALFSDTGEAAGASGFISLDGAGLDRIVVRGLGSRRYRVTLTGPGGHSWMDWGTPNPIHALVGIASALAALQLTDDPVTTLTLARIGGGKSINAIPQEAWLEIDTRSSSNERLTSLEAEIRRLADEGARAAGLQMTVDVIGDRPGGKTGLSDPLVKAALEATRHQGREPTLALSSTDANIPMAAGIAALTLGCGGEAGAAHTTSEWYRNTNGADGVVRALHTVLLFAGVA